jgi:hypothetical protein
MDSNKTEPSLAELAQKLRAAKAEVTAAEFVVADARAALDETMARADRAYEAYDAAKRALLNAAARIGAQS